MKAAIVLALATAAAAAPSATVCPIPAKYTTGTGATGCTGVQTGYRVFRYCTLEAPAFQSTNALATAAAAGYTTAAAFDFTELTASTLSNFGLMMLNALDPTGCVIPNPGFAGMLATGAAPPAACLTGGGAGADALGTQVGGAASAQTGVFIQCADNFYPSAGLPGSAPCVQGAAMENGYFANFGNYFGTTGFQSTDNYVANFPLNSNAATESLTCTAGCDLSAAAANGLCANNALHANVWVAGDGLVTGTCTLRPTHPLFPTGLTIGCVSSGKGATWTASCNAGVLTTTYTGQCGTADGATSSPRAAAQEFHIVTTQTAAENTIFGYENVSSVLILIAFTTNNGWFFVRNWNANPNQPLQTGNVQRIDITGCTSAVTATRVECVQRTLNWWRCEGFHFDGGVVCYANNIQVACPQHELGFRCETSSKKGLLGLLGLLGLIPLLLCLLILCCCLCCIPRKKSTGEVHMSTFDPQPAVAAGSIAPATACYAPSIGAVPAPAPIGVF